MCASQTLSVPAANQKDANQTLYWLVTLPWTQEEVINTRSSDHKENSEPQLQWNNPEGRRDVPDFATCVTQARKSLTSPIGEAYLHSPHSLPYRTLYIPLGELRPWLDAPLQDKAERS